MPIVARRDASSHEPVNTNMSTVHWQHQGLRAATADALKPGGQGGAYSSAPGRLHARTGKFQEPENVRMSTGRIRDVGQLLLKP